MRKIHIVLDAFSQLVFRLDDPREGEAIACALAGRGKPAGVRGCEQQAGNVIVRLDPAITPPELVRHLVEIERRRYASRTERAARLRDDGELARMVGAAIGEPELDEHRILERLVPELDSP